MLKSVCVRGRPESSYLLYSKKKSTTTKRKLGFKPKEENYADKECFYWIKVTPPKDTQGGVD